ncbi:MAG: glucose-6-phosphate dehydrogenase [Candidatus Doudnabacteria bacterium RIFCSPHIGHO2_01_FULL_46_14]|uniref:Glucose-6-phosphate 1-dehydrogenase n=1 Tax=Candidatus Doudnabacteria bacterium RIFCSPHIGHO2_01_FULL_46_14 TaxID=1817824 RepID=A0A1F5NKI5_9BACT|nr:MAG: glucose-6-phosphate dehydrogenase [Candidatus Doudnabacteria bacterium RIFCSPHIGHO2_01_FULL_46_14]
MQKEHLDPTILVIFGATGDLAGHRLIPALNRLYKRKLLPKSISIVGFARSEFSHEQFRKKIEPPGISKEWNKFAKKIYYMSGNFTNENDFKKLAKLLVKLESKNHSCANRLFYFATLPSHYHTISHALDKSGLLVGCRIHKRQTRVVIEKPFGSDLKSAKKLDETLEKYFSESQIYRIDHYLGKETVQNILTVRFANSIFEPIWNRKYIDHIQISSLEERGIENRGAFYEQTGAIRDVVQNHMMQLVAHIAMEAPHDLSATAIRDERAKVIKQIRMPKAKEMKNSLAAGQYAKYRAEPNIHPKSTVETFAALKLHVDNPRWQGVPFYLRAGKKLKSKITEISIHFKRPLPDLFGGQPDIPNVLNFEIHPNEGLFLDIAAKFPGFGIRLHPVTMELGYHSAFQGEFPEAYERLLLDFIEGDQRLFARSDEIEYSWKYIDEIEKYLKKTRVSVYPAGSWGPEGSDKLIKKDQRQWHIR